MNKVSKKIRRSLLFHDLKKYYLLALPVLAVVLIGIGLLYSSLTATAEISYDLSVKGPAFNDDNYSYNSDPIFKLDTKGAASSSEEKKGEGSLIVDNGVKIVARAIRSDMSDVVVPEIVTLGEGDKFEVNLNTTPSFKPGRYRLIVEIIESGNVERVEKDFSWGVLALNLDKSTYAVGEISNFGMAVLDDEGVTICDADLKLVITAPNNKTTTLSTNNDAIGKSEMCKDKSVTNLPDYKAEFIPEELGEYEIYLEATTANGTRITTEKFDVVESADFVVKRYDTATRIYPLSSYGVNVKITSTNDFSGKIIETVPAEFELSEISASIENTTNADTKMVPSEKITSDSVGLHKRIIVSELGLNAGETVNLYYVYLAPPISPEFYLLGPLTIWQTTLDDPTEYEKNTESFETEDDLDIEIANEDIELGSDLQLETTVASRLIETVIFSEPRPWQIASDTLTGNTHASAYTLTTGFNGNFNDATYPATNAYASDDAYASTGFSDKRNKEYATNFRGFDFSGIPDGSTINSVNVYVERKADIANGVAEWRSTVWADVTAAAPLAPGVVGAFGPDTQYTTSTNPTTDGYWNYALTGTLPTTAELKGANFGLRAQIANGNNGTDLEYFIDDIYMVVDYTAATINIAGTSNGSGTVKWAKNGAVQAEENAIAGGSWTLSGITAPATNDIITVWIDAVADSSESTGVARYTGSGNVAGMVLDTNVLTVGSDQDLGVTVTNMNQYDCTQDEDIMHDAASSTILVQGDTGCVGGTPNSYTDEEIDILGSDTLTIGGTETLTTDNVTIGGTITSGGNSSYNVSGNWVNSGVFTESTSTVTFNASSGTQTITSGGTGANYSFNNITHSAAGILQLVTNAIDIEGAFNQTSGTFDSNGLSQNIGGNFSLSNSTTYIKGGTLTFDESGTSTMIDSNSTLQDLGAVVVDGSTKTINLGSSSDVTTMTVGTDDTLGLASSGYTLKILGAGTAGSRPFLMNAGGTLNEGTSSTVEFAGTEDTDVEDETYDNLDIKPTAGGGWVVASAGDGSYNGTYTYAGELNGDPYYTYNSRYLYRATTPVSEEVWRLWTSTQTDFTPPVDAAYYGQFDQDLPSNTWSVGSGTPSAPTLSAAAGKTFILNTGTVNVTSNLTVGNGTNTVDLTAATNNPILNVDGDLTIAADATLTASSSASFTIAGSYSNSGTFTHSSGTVTFDAGSAGKTLAGTLDSTSGFSALTFSNGSGGWTINNALQANGNFNLTAGALTQGANIDLTFLGDVTLASGTTFTKASGAGKFIMDGDDLTESYDDQHGTKSDIGNVQIGLSPGTTKLKSDMSAASLTILTGDTFETHGWDVTLSDYFDCQGTGVFDLTDGPPSAAGDGTIVSVGGNYTMSATGTFTPSTDSLVTFTGNASADQTVTTGAKAFYGVTVNNNQGTYDDVIISGNFDGDGDLTVTDGVLELSANDPTITTAGNVAIGGSGAMVQGTGTWTFDGFGTSTWNDSGASQSSFGVVTIDGTTKTVNLTSSVTTISTTVGADDIFGLASSGYTLTITGSGTGGSRPFLINTGGTLNEGTNSTVKFEGTINTTIQEETYFNLEIKPSGGGGDWVVSGAGDSNYNGSYIETGTQNGDPYYVYNSRYLFRATNPTSQEVWRLDTAMHGDLFAPFSDDYYGQISAALPANSWSVGTGTGPAPSLAVGGDPTYTLATAGSKTVNCNNLVVGDGTNGVELTSDTYDPTLNVDGDMTIVASGTFTASNSGTTTFGGSYSNAGTFTHSSGSITFDAGATGKTIVSGGTGAGYDFNTIIFNNSLGGWTIQTNNLTTQGNLTITDTAAAGFTVNSVVLEVKGTHSIVDAETANTTWTSATLYLNSGTAYIVGSRTQTVETYATLQIGANTDIKTWQSDATTETVDASGSLYSQDHANVDGDLYIWGDYHVITNDYWSYATDFEGTAVTRQVDVRVDPTAKVTVDSSDTLAAIGTGANRTTVSRQGGSNGYEMSCLSSGTINFQYTDFDYLDGALGIDIQSGSTVTSLDNTDFDNLVGSVATDDAYITVASAVIGAVSKSITGVNFDNTDALVDFNVNRTGSDDTGDWTFDTHTGTFDGESFDGKTGLNEDDPGMLIWDDSTASNIAPNDPSSLAQKKTDDTVLNVGDWTDEISVKFTASVDDTDNPDTLYLCVEKDVTGVAFSDTEDSCGSGVAYSGSPVAATVTISSQTDDTEYHWQARTKDLAGEYSSWVVYGGNADPNDRDYGIDTSAPTGGTVNDGVGADIDYNNGSLSTLSANWSSVDSNVSGLNKYEYAIGTTQGATDTKTWTDNSTTANVTDSALTLRTGQTYYFTVRTIDNAGNVSTAINSDGQAVASTLTFGYFSGSTITFNDLNSGNSWTDSTKTTVLQTSTNAYGGYVVKARAIDELRHVSRASLFFSHYAGTNETPTTWSGTGFGYTTSDDNLSGGTADRFTNGGPKYAGWGETGPGDPVADHTSAVTGTPISNEQFTITYRVTGDALTDAGQYQSAIVYTCIPQY